jgi:hypothetical protein
LSHAGELVLRGVAFRSSRAEPFGEAFLRRAIARLLNGDIAGVRAEFVATAEAIRQRQLTTFDVSARVRLTKTPAEYFQTRTQRRELSYEAMLEHGRNDWAVGERIRVYRGARGRPGLLADPDAPASASVTGARDYDIEYYLRLLRDTFAARLERGLSPDDFAAVCADPGQPSLFERPLSEARPVLTVLEDPLENAAPAHGSP